MSSQPIVINIGAIPNDGTGDPLRTAFNDVNLNFANVFAYGPVLSNVQIANNTILTTNTNGNLVLSPNGTGVVQSNVNIVPNTANIRNLGSATQRWSTVYAQYLDVSANLNIAGNIVYNGDLTVDGNLTVQGNIIQVGNIVTETLTIQLANAATTPSAANGSGITVGANDNIATVLYNSTGNVWTTNIGLSSVGNITAPYFFGNGSQLTGLGATYGNANVVTLLAGFGSNTVSTTGNVTAGNFITSGIVSATGNVRGANFNTVGLVSAVGNISGNYFFGNGSQLTGINAGSSNKIFNGNSYANIATANGNVEISANGNAWAFGTDGTLTFPDNSGSDWPVNTQRFGMGNIGAWLDGQWTIGEFSGNGVSGTVGIRIDPAIEGYTGMTFPSSGTSNTQPVQIYSTNGSGIELYTGSNNWTFNANGTTQFPSDTIRAPANSLLQIQTTTSNSDDNQLRLDLTAIDLYAYNSNADSWSEVLLNNGNVAAPTAQIIVKANAGPELKWTFDAVGNLTLPGNTSSINYANGQPYSGGGGGANTGNVTFDNNIVIGTGDSFGGGGLNLAIGPDSIANGNVQYLQVRGGDNPTHIHLDTGDNTYFDQYFGDDGKFVRLDAGDFGNVTVGTYNPGESYNWTFGNDGNTTVPGDIQSITTGFPFTSNIANIDLSTLPAVYVELVDNEFGGEVTGQVTITGVVGTTQANGTWYFEAVESNYIQLYNDAALTSPVNGNTWTAYESGGSAVAAGYSNLSITGGNVSVVTNTGNTWTFGADGSVIFPTLTVDLHNGGTQTGQVLQFGDGSQQAIITGPAPTPAGSNAQRLIIQGQNGGDGEGGDVYVWGGDSNVNGGDIKIYAGDADTAGRGGNIHIAGGRGTTTAGEITLEGGENDGGDGAYVSLTGGRGTSTGGVVSLNGGFGEVTGGDINITGGVGGNGLGSYGNVGISAGASSWAFDNTGNLTLPQAGVVYETNIPFGGLEGKTIALKPSGGTNADQQLLIYPTAGADFNHLHLTTGNLWNTEMFLGNDDFYVKLANTGSIVINTNGNDGNTAQWAFDPYGAILTDSNLFIQTPSGVPATVTAITGSSGSWESNPTSDLATTGGTGTGLTVNVTQEGGYAGTIAIATPGNGYSNGDAITVTSGSSSATFTISVVNNQWTFGVDGNLLVPQGGYIGAAGVKGDGTMLTGGKGNIASLTSFYANVDALNYSSCVTVNADGTLNITTYGDGTGQLGQWNYANTTLYVPGNGSITTNNAVSAAGGNNVTVQAGAADQNNFNANSGGNLNLSGGLGGFNDDGSGGPGGNVNISAGSPGEAGGVAGNVTVNTGTNTWTFDNTGDLILPTISLGSGLDEQTVIQSQRRLIPPFRYSAEITGTAPTVVYTATDVNTTSMKVTMQIQHTGLGFEFFEVFATYTGSTDAWYTVSNRVAPPTIDASTVVVDLNGSNTMQITVTINSGAATSWVTYDAVEFGIPND